MQLSKFYTFIICFLIMCATALCVNKALFGHSYKNQENEQNKIESKAVAPSDTISILNDNTVIIHTDLLTDVTGYADKVPLDIEIKDGIITSIKVLENSETPSFFERAEVITKEWIGKSVVDAVNMRVDAVTGATYSSDAIKENVKAGLDYYLDKHDVPESREIPIKIWIALAVTLVACIVPLFVKNKWYNRVQLLANVIVLGFWSGQFLDYSLMLKYLSNGFIFPIGIIAVLMLISAFIFPLFGKPQHYCNHVCPLGSAQILMAEIFKYKIKISAKLLKGLNIFRKILWMVLMLLLWTGIYSDWMNYELFQAFLFESASPYILAATIIVVVLSAVIARPYCRFICPTGSLFKFSENIP